MNLTEAEDIRKRWQEYTAELYKKDLHDPDNNDGVITDLEPDILECEVKWDLGSHNIRSEDQVHTSHYKSQDHSSKFTFPAQIFPRRKICFS